MYVDVATSRYDQHSPQIQEHLFCTVQQPSSLLNLDHCIGIGSRLQDARNTHKSVNKCTAQSHGKGGTTKNTGNVEGEGVEGEREQLFLTITHLIFVQLCLEPLSNSLCVLLN